jgi:CRP/FNR family transcriptional regulator
MDVRKLLQKSHLCAGLSSDELDQILAIATIRSLSKGQILFLEGDNADGFYILLEGRIRVYKAGPDGREQTLHQIRAGQTFGEAAVFGGIRFPANSAAIADAAVAYLPFAAFRDIVATSPDISLKMIGAMAGFLREFTQIIENLSLKEVSARLAGYLLEQHQKSGSATIRLTQSKAELARQLGTISETLSRNLRKLKELQIIAVTGKDITVLDVHKLAEIASGEKF